MKGKRVLAILTSLALTVGTLSVTAFAADAAPEAATEAAAEAAPEEQEEQEEQQEEPEVQETPEEICSREGHQYEVVQEDPATCTEDGTIFYECSRCGDTKTEKGEKAHGHSFGDGVITRQPTEDSEGEMTYTCRDCGETKTESIAKLEKQEIPNLTIGFDEITKDSGKVEAGKGSIKYEYKKKGKGKDETVTLTFKKATLEADSPKGQDPAPEAAISYTGEGKLVLSLEDENTVTGTTYTIYAPEAEVEITGEEGASLTVQAAPQNSNAIRAKEINIKDPAEITAPEEAYVFTGDNGNNTTYQTVAVENGGRNVAATSLTVRIPDKETEEKSEETEEEKKKEDADAAADSDTDADKDAEKDAAVDADTDADKDTDQDTAKADKDTDKEDQDADQDEQQEKEDSAPEEKPVVFRVDGTDYPGEAASPVEVGGGKIEFEVSGEGADQTVTLTLDNVTIDSAFDAAVEYVGEGSLAVVLKGENSLTGTTYGIYAPDGKINVSGELQSSLKAASSADESVQQGFAVYAGDISIEQPLGIVDPENGEIFKDSYATISYKEDGRNKAALTAKIAHVHEWGEPEYKWSEDNSSVTATRSCTTEGCEEEETETVEPEKSVTKEPTCEEKGESLYTAVFKNEAFEKQEKKAEEPALGHDWDISKFNWAKDYSEATADFVCKRDEKHTKTVKADVTSEKSGDKTKYTAVVELGRKTYTEVKIVGADDKKEHTHNWSDAEYEWADDFSTCTATHSCQEKGCDEKETETVPATESTTATCVKDGKITYTAEFDNGAFETQTKEVETKAFGHSWGYPEFTWSENSSKATATFVCDRCGDKKVVSAKVTGMITVPTTKKDGKIDFTARAALDGEEYTDKAQKPVKAAGQKGYKFTVKPTSWARNGNKAMSLTIKRDIYDVITFSAFKTLTIDGKKVENKNNSSYTAEKGSLKLTFKPAFLKTLSDGTHTLKVNFADGSVETKFTVSATGATGTSTTGAKGKTATGSPRTGDTSNWALWIGLIAVSAIAIGAIIYARKRGKK